MIRKLRKKFVIIAMCSVLAVLVIIIGSINVVNYVNVVKNANNIVELLKDGNGIFEDRNTDDFGGVPQKPISPETPFETRFFTVELNNVGQAVAVNIAHIAAVDENEARQYAVDLYQNGSTQGFYGQYRYGVTSTEKGGKLYVFVDCARELANFNNFLWISVSVSAVGLAIVFGLVYILSTKVLKPISESYSKQKQFITNASHEIKTPLTIIGADTEILEMQHGENEWTESIKFEVKRLASLTEKLVFLARMDEDNSLNLIDFSISDAVDETVKSFEAVALAHGIGISCNIQRNLTYCGDEFMIRQLMYLLVDNAIKYSDSNTTVDVELLGVANKVVIYVKNRNSDLPEGTLSCLFERFYRGDKSRNSQTGGHGIGLSVAQSIVNAHKGKIYAKCENGTVTFTVTL